LPGLNGGGTAAAVPPTPMIAAFCWQQSPGSAY